jgi:hypothetical protein
MEQKRNRNTPKQIRSRQGRRANRRRKIPKTKMMLHKVR